MKKKFGKRLLSVGAAVLMAVSLLSVSALAADCKHVHMEKGFCDDCDTQYTAVVGKTYYKSIGDAVKAADKQSDKAVTLLTDLKGENLKLGGVYLAVDKEAVTIEKCTLTGTGDYLVLNKGKLILQDTTLKNTKGAYALMDQGGTTVLSKVTMKAETAQVRMNGGKLELATAPVDGTVFVENDLPGDFAVAIGKSADKAENSWISNSVERPIYESAKKLWRLTGSIKHAVDVDEAALIYNGELQLPAIKVELYGRQLVEGIDYEVICPIPDPMAAVYEDEGIEPPENPDPIKAGHYTLRVNGLGIYSGSCDWPFIISRAVPVLNWSKATDTVTYTGSPAVLNETVKVETGDGEKYEGEISYTYRAAGSEDDFVSGLPVNAGKYEVMAAVEAFENHEAAETETALVLTIAPKAVQPAVKVLGEGISYNGKEHTPAVTLMDGDSAIPADAYTVSYENNVNVGSAVAKMAAVDGGNYTFTEKVEVIFNIAKAEQTPVTIQGAPATVTYGDRSFQLTLSGGSTENAVQWKIIEGSGRAEVNEQGYVTVLSVGKVTVEAVKAGDDNYMDASAQWSFEIAPAVLTIEEVQATDKVFDGTKTVDISKVTVSGIKGNDDIHVRTEGLKGELSDSKVGTYKTVKLVEPKIAGISASCYKLEVPADGVPTNVNIKKADLTTALESIEVQMTIGSEQVAVENLGGAMPADAGKLTYTNRLQTTGEGTQAIVLNWSVDANGKLTAHVVNGKGGDKITFEVAVASENYNTAVVKVIVSYGAKTVEADKVSVTFAGNELVYNGQAQKPTPVVKYDGGTLEEGVDYEVTYPENLTAAGEKEIKLTFKGSYEGSATAKYTVNKAKLVVNGTKVADKSYNGTTDATVTMGVVTGAVEGDEVKVTAAGIFNDKNSGSRTVKVTYKLEGKAAANYVLDKETEDLTAKITPVTAAQLSSGIGGITVSNVTSDNRGALQSIIAKANAAMEDTGLKDSEKTDISNVRANAESIIQRIEAAAAAANTDSIRATKSITAENVKVSDKAALQKTKTDLSNALNSYKANYTAKEEQAIKEQQTRVDAALTVLTRVESAATLINALPDDMENAANLGTSVQDAKESYNKLSDYEKTLIEEPLKNKLTAAGLAAGVGGDVEPEATPVVTPQQTVGGADNGSQETIQLPMWIFWVAVMMASLIALGFVWSKIKKSKEKNW